MISSFFCAFLNGQDNETIIDPVFYECYKLIDTARIEPIKLDGFYSGKAMLQAKVDTLTDTLKDFSIVFAKLYSSKDTKDSIEIRYLKKYGNYTFLDEHIDEIVPIIAQKRIIRTNLENCIVPLFTFAIKIIEK
jgi:hypothetical protein